LLFVSSGRLVRPVHHDSLEQHGLVVQVGHAPPGLLVDRPGQPGADRVGDLLDLPALEHGAPVGLEVVDREVVDEHLDRVAVVALVDEHPLARVQAPDERPAPVEVVEQAPLAAPALELGQEAGRVEVRGQIGELLDAGLSAVAHQRRRGRQESDPQEQPGQDRQAALPRPPLRGHAAGMEPLEQPRPVACPAEQAQRAADRARQVTGQGRRGRDPQEGDVADGGVGEHGEGHQQTEVRGGRRQERARHGEQAEEHVEGDHPPERGVETGRLPLGDVGQEAELSAEGVLQVGEREQEPVDVVRRDHAGGDAHHEVEAERAQRAERASRRAELRDHRGGHVQHDERQAQDEAAVEVGPGGEQQEHKHRPQPAASRGLLHQVQRAEEEQVAEQVGAQAVVAHHHQRRHQGDQRRGER